MPPHSTHATVARSGVPRASSIRGLLLPVGGTGEVGRQDALLLMLVAVPSPLAPAMAVIDRWYHGTEP